MLLTKWEHAQIFWHILKNLFLVQDQCAKYASYMVEGTPGVPYGGSTNYFRIKLLIKKTILFLRNPVPVKQQCILSNFYKQKLSIKCWKWL